MVDRVLWRVDRLLWLVGGVYRLICASSDVQPAACAAVLL